MKPTGYGNFYLGHRYETAHRASWILYRGVIPEGMFVCHKCDNRNCVNPDHLFLGTPKDNIRDMIRKGRARGVSAGGENHPIAKLTHVEAREIRELRRTGLKLKEISKRYGVSEATVSYVCSGKIWAGEHGVHLEMEVEQA